MSFFFLLYPLLPLLPSPLPTSSPPHPSPHLLSCSPPILWPALLLVSRVTPAALETVSFSLAYSQTSRMCETPPSPHLTPYGHSPALPSPTTIFAPSPLPPSLLHTIAPPDGSKQSPPSQLLSYTCILEYSYSIYTPCIYIYMYTLYIYMHLVYIICTQIKKMNLNLS